MRRQPPKCSLRVAVFCFISIAMLSRFIWMAVDPRGAKFILHSRMTAQTMEPLHVVKGFDYVLISIGYVCLFSTNTEISSFWVRVSIRFQPGDQNDK